MNQPNSKDICARPSCGWYRRQHHETTEGLRCPYHYRRNNGNLPTFVEPAA